MKNALLTLAAILMVSSQAFAMRCPASDNSNFEDPNNPMSSLGSKYQAAKKRMGGCGAVAPGNAVDGRLIQANDFRLKESPLSRASAQARSSI